MDDATADSIRSASRAEAERRAHPTDFPALPPLPAARYTAPELYALEQERVFRGSWLLACHQSEVPDAGSALALSHLPAPLVFVRDRERVVRAFANSCRHRGSRLLADGQRQLERALLCPYHGWAYTLDGRLAGVPEEREFRDLDKECLGLAEIRSACWGGFVWIDLDGSAPPFREWAGPIADDMDADIGSLDATTSHVVMKKSYAIDCNWKLAIEANLETYHVNALHRASAASVIDSRTTTSTLFESGHSRMFLRTMQEPPGELPLGKFAGVHAIAGEGVLTYSFFPNVALVVSPQLMFTTNAWPISPGRTHYELYFIAAEPKSEANQAVLDLMLGFNVGVIEEDVAVLAGMQRSLESGNVREVHFAYAERRLHHLHEALDAAIGLPRIPEALRTTRVLSEGLR